MHSLLVPLKRICRENLTGKKNLIMPSYLDGNTSKKSLSREGFFALNLNVTTLFDLARDYCDDYVSKNKLKILDNSLGQILLLQILKKLSRGKLLDYFQPPAFSPGISRSIYLAIKELRIAGFSSRNFPHPAIVNPKKSEDLLKIMQEYEKILREQNYIDEADIYLQAIKYKNKCREKSQQKKEIFIAPSNIELNYLEEIFFREIILPETKVIHLPAPKNLNKPISFYFSESYKEEENYPEKPLALDYLYDIDKMPSKSDLPEKLNIELIQSHGEFNEVKTIIRKIKSQKIPLDEVSIFYTVQEPYSQYLYQLSRQYSLNITFGNGISIKNTSPAKLFFALIDWIRDNYSIAKLYFLLTGGNFEFKNWQSNPDDIPTPQRVATLLRNSPIGRKRNRYIKGIDLVIKQLEREIEQVSKDRQERYRKKLKDLFWTKEFITQIFHELPQENFDYTISPKQIARGLINIVTNYSKIDEENNLDEEAIKKIKERLTILIGSDYPLPDMPVNEALILIADLIKNERVNCSEPRGGCLHTASYKKGIWLNRSYNFIVGMDSAKFPDSAHDGSILLDAEKKNTGRINPIKEKGKENQYKILQLLASLKGKIILSYSRFDTEGNRELAPSSLMLQLYRLKTGDKQKDYSDFYNSFKDIFGFVPCKPREILDSADWFLYSARHNHNSLNIVPLFKRIYPALSEGFYAAQQREKEELNRFNGKVKVDPKQVDPRLNRGLVVSSSRLELIAFCPYLYFLKYILKIKPPQEMIEDPGVWLDPSERGIIFHQIFEEFYKKLKEISPPGTFISPSYDKHWHTLEDITLSQLEQKRKRLAPPNNLVYQHESKEILDSCRFFLHCEEEKYKGEIPTYLELAFGTRDNQNEGLGKKIKAVKLTLPGGKSISFQGKIDRIDKLDEDTYRIIDYKTGTPYGFSQSKYFQNGKQIQHALYALSLKKILAKAGISAFPKIQKAGYYFPTLNGQGRQYFYGEERRNQVLEIIDLLLDIVARGNFAMIQKADDFMCADYRDILEQNQVMEVSGKNAKKYDEEPALDNLRRLQEEYE